MSRKARRAFARSLGRGPFRPEQLGVAAFSAAFLAFGATALALTAPPLIQQEMLARHAAVAPLFGGAAQAAEDDVDSADAPGAAEADGASVDASGNAAGADSAGGGAVLFPTVDFSSIESLVDASSSGQGSSGGSGAGNGGGSGSTGETPGAEGGQNDGSAGISEADEQAYLAYLRQCYDALPTYQQSIAQAYADFPTLALEPSRDVRNLYWAQAIDVRNAVDIALMSMEENRLPDASRYFNDYLNIKTLYEDLSNAGAILARAWASNLQFDDPAAYEYYWMGPIRDNSSGGKLTFFADYEARYPGARP
ncbi:MAG TPA: hypothetical protein IAC12_00675 [Candidatus Aphodovivens avistercoris]|nr:hypothetical protein [Candidatus Aphodovivens avistercoris]